MMGICGRHMFDYEKNMLSAIALKNRRTGVIMSVTSNSKGERE